MALEYLNNLSNQWNENVQTSNDSESWDDFLRRHITSSDAELYVQELSHCMCCDIHQKYRPIEFKKYIISRPHNEICNGYRCGCPCRHYSRGLCRLFGNE